MPYALSHVFTATPAPNYAFAHAGGVLLLPSIYGPDPYNPGVSAWWSADGAAFVAATFDGAGLPEGSYLEAPFREVNGFANNKVATPDGLVLCKVGRQLMTVSVGPIARLATADFVRPQEAGTVTHVVVDHAGTWWLAGYAWGDPFRGLVYSSPDGKRWTLAADKHNAIKCLIVHGRRVIGLHYKQFSEVTPTGLVKLGAAKTHLDTAVVTAAGDIVAVGERVVSVLGAGAKRTKYGSSPVERAQLLAVADGVLLGGEEGLFFAADGLTWTQITATPVKDLFSTTSGPVVVTNKAEVLAVRST